MISVTVTLVNRDEVLSMLDRLQDIGERLGPPMIDAGLDFARAVLLDIFAGEGQSGVVGTSAWEPLAKWTQWEREMLALPGIGPEHPILIRYGTLMESLTDESSMDHQVTVTHVAEGHWRAQMGTQHPHFEELQEGNEHRKYKLPARPMWPVGDAETRFVGALNEHVLQVMRREF